MLMEPLMYYDKACLHARNLEQDKYKALEKKLLPISKEVKYDVLECSNDVILPVRELNRTGQKIVVFDDYMCDKNQKDLIDYFAQARHKNCSVVFLRQSFFECPKTIRMNCSHFCVYEFRSSKEKSLISNELSVSKEQYKKVTNKPF